LGFGKLTGQCDPGCDGTRQQRVILTNQITLTMKNPNGPRSQSVGRLVYLAMAKNVANPSQRPFRTPNPKSDSQNNSGSDGL